MFDCCSLSFPFLLLLILPFPSFFHPSFPGSRLPTWPFPGDTLLPPLGLLSSSSSSSPPRSPCRPGRSSSTRPSTWRWCSAAPATKPRSEVASAGRTLWTCPWWSARWPCWSTTPTPATFWRTSVIPWQQRNCMALCLRTMWARVPGLR